MRLKSFEKVTKISIAVIMILITILTVFGVVSYFYFTHDLPSIETLRNYKPSTVTKILSEDGEIIGEFFYEKREVVSLDRIPNHLIQAFIAGEDARFFQHKGLDYLAIFRAFVRNTFSGEIVQGGSTITQQVVKSLLLSPERSFARKIREAILAYRIEKHLTKEEILFLYLNQIYLGHGAYGVAAAAESYFAKAVEDLSVAESAVLAGLPQAPSKYSPYQHPQQAKKRQVYILNRMAEEGFIPPSEASKAAQASYTIRAKEKPSLEKASHFVEYPMLLGRRMRHDLASIQMAPKRPGGPSQPMPAGVLAHPLVQLLPRCGDQQPAFLEPVVQLSRRSHPERSFPPVRALWVAESFRRGRPEWDPRDHRWHRGKKPLFHHLGCGEQRSGKFLHLWSPETEPAFQQL